MAQMKAAHLADQAKIHALDEAVAFLKHKLSIAGDDKKKLIRQLERICARLKELELVNEKQAATISDLRDKEKRAALHIADLKLQLQAKERLTTELYASNGKQDATIAELKAQLRSQRTKAEDATIAELKARLEEKDKLIRELKEVVMKLRDPEMDEPMLNKLLDFGGCPLLSTAIRILPVPTIASAPCAGKGCPNGFRMHRLFGSFACARSECERECWNYRACKGCPNNYNMHTWFATSYRTACLRDCWKIKSDT